MAGALLAPLTSPTEALAASNEGQDILAMWANVRLMPKHNCHNRLHSQADITGTNT